MRAGMGCSRRIRWGGIFDPKQPAFNFTFEKGRRRRFAIESSLISQEADAAELNKEADAFAAEK